MAHSDVILWNTGRYDAVHMVLSLLKNHICMMTKCPQSRYNR